MTNPTNLYKAYSRATHTVAKTRQIVMLYDGAIRFLSQAKEAMEQGQIERRFNTLNKVYDIIVGLQTCLDFEAGNTAAQALYDFYSSIDSRILQLQRTDDAAMCAELIAEMKEMRDVWDGIDRGAAEPAAPAPDSGEPTPVQTVIVSA